MCVQQCFTGTQLVNSQHVLVNSLHSGIPTTTLYSLRFPTHILHKHVEKDWMQLNTAAFQSGVESWSASARCFLLPVGLFRLWQQIVPCPFFSRTWSRVCGRILLILWCTFALLFFSSLCFGACCCLSSLKSLEVQSTSYKNLLSCDECIILPHLTIFFNTPT